MFPLGAIVARQIEAFHWLFLYDDNLTFTAVYATLLLKQMIEVACGELAPMSVNNSSVFSIFAVTLNYHFNNHKLRI